MRFSLVPKGLLGRLLVVQFLLLICMTSFLFGMFSFLERRFWNAFMIREAAHNVKLLTPVVMRSFGRGAAGNGGRMPAEMAKLLEEKEGIYTIVVIDNVGRQLFAMNDRKLPPFDSTSYTHSQGVSHRDIRINGTRVLDILVPFESIGKSGFYVRYALTFPAFETQVVDTHRLILVTGILSLGIAFVLAYVYTRRITGPLQELTGAADAIRRGESGIEIPPLSGELGVLSAALSTMLHALAEKQHEMALQNEKLNTALDDLLALQQRMVAYERLAALGRVSVGLSHEVDNPLGIIIAHGEYMLGELPADSPLRSDIESVLREANRIKTMTRALLSFGKPHVFVPVDVELAPMVRELTEAMSVQHTFSKVEIDYRLADVVVRADRERMYSVLTNLVANAVQAMDGDGRLILTTGVADGMGFVSVGDTGPGIPEALRAKVLEPFFTTKDAGTGLGLAMSRQFIEKMDGRIVIGTSEGGGADIAIYLPLAGGSSKTAD